MAYTNTYIFNFKSNANLSYRVEFWDQGTGASGFSGIEGTLGPEAVSVKYDSSDVSMFAHIKASTLSIDFMVTDSVDAGYISALRTDRQERDVYVYMYGPSPNPLTPTSVNNPAFAGYLLMDLADDPEVSVPFRIKLKAVDGLASLKYYDFIPPTTSQKASNLYSIEETWIPDSSNSGGTYPGYRTMVEWMQKILYYSGYATTAKGAMQEAQIMTSCNWFNGQMASTSVDPLVVTRSRALQWYGKQGETGSIKYKAITCYEALVSICKSFGLRCIAYRNRFYFISLTNYENNNSGTLASPVNIKYFKYDIDTTVSPTSGDSLDMYWGRYYIPIDNAPATQTVNQKLAGTNYGFIAPLKKVVVKFINLADYNYFNGFPLLPNPLGACPDQGYAEYTNLGVIDFDGVTDQMYFCNIWLDFINNSPDGEVEFETRYTISAREVGSTGQWMEWGTGATGVPQWTLVNPSYGIGYEMSKMHILPQGASSINISEPAGMFGWLRQWIEFPTSAFPAGSYQLRFKIAATWFCPAPESFVDGHGGTESISNPGWS